MTSRYILRRLASTALTFWFIATLVFLLFRLLPGNPADVLVDPLAGPEARQQVIVQLGLDRSLYLQYAVYLNELARGRLGMSFVHHIPVVSVLRPAFLNTLVLALATFIPAYGIGALVGVALGWGRGTTIEAVGSFLTLVIRSAPTFWLGLLGMIVFGLRLHWVPLSGLASLGSVHSGLRVYATVDFLRHLILPTVTGVLFAAGLPIILMRNAVIETLHEAYVDLARAKGLPERRVMYAHAARTALLPLIAESAQFLGWAMGGLVAIEFVFNWPGLGLALVNALSARDYPVGQGCFLTIAGLVIVLNFLSDVVAAVLNPQVRFA